MVPGRRLRASPTRRAAALTAALLALVALALAAPATGSPWVDEPLELRPVPEVDAGHLPAVGIVGGEESAADAWPAVVAVYDLNEIFACTGTLVADDLVLTAGHCGFGMETVHVGSVDLEDDPGEVYDIVEGWVHPDHYITYDVTLYRLDRAVPGVTPRDLLVDCLATDYLTDGAEGIIVGFGAIDEYAGVRPTRLHEASLPIVDADCDEPSRGCNVGVLPEGELIAGGDGIDSCSGDSGGPLFIDTPEGQFLAGITSRAALPVRQPCGGGGIYVRTDAIDQWIEDVSGLSLSRPDCQATNRAPSVTVAPIVTDRLTPARTTLEVSDPNVGQNHTVEVLTPPAQGRVRLLGDVVHFYPDVQHHGETSATFLVTDDGEPPRSVEVEVPIQVFDVVIQERARSCSSSGTGPAPWFALLGVAMVMVRRR